MLTIKLFLFGKVSKSNVNNNIADYNVKEITTQFIVERKNFFAVKKITLTKQVRKDDRQEKSIYSFSKLFCIRMTNRWKCLSPPCHPFATKLLSGKRGLMALHLQSIY